MSMISIKIVEVHQPSRSVVVKFASEHSARPIDEYDGLAFNVANFSSLTPEEFIESIRPQISKLVAARDQSERVVESINVSEWQGFSTTVESIEIPEVAPVISAQIIPALTNPEVIL